MEWDQTLEDNKFPIVSIKLDITSDQWPISVIYFIHRTTTRDTMIESINALQTTRQRWNNLRLPLLHPPAKNEIYAANPTGATQAAPYIRKGKQE